MDTITEFVHYNQPVSVSPSAGVLEGTDVNEYPVLVVVLIFSLEYFFV